jgi:hypothetical protein
MDISALRMRALEFLDKLPFDFLAWDPYISHFALSLPVIALLLQVISTIAPTKGFGSSSILLFSLSTFSVLLAYIRRIPPFDSSFANVIETDEGLYASSALAIWILLKSLNVVKSDMSRHFVMFVIFFMVAGLFYRYFT